MTRITVDAEVEIDLNEHIGEFDDDDLIREIESRGFAVKDNGLEQYKMILENLYYALRDGTKEDAIKIVNPLLDEALGREV